MTEELIGPRAFGVRACVFGDVTVRSDGDGRTVEAYTAVFNRGAEIRDQDGHYEERIAPGSFSETIARNGLNFGVFYNHARTIYGTPDGALSVPIGVPVEAPRQDEHGVFTVTRYLDNPLADSVLDGIKQRAIRGYSFSGKFIRSTRSKGERGGLPTITRREVAMREYGPTVFPAYTEAAIVGTRAESFLHEIAALAPDEVERLRTMLGIAHVADASGSPTGAAHVEDDPAPVGQSARHVTAHAQLMARWAVHPGREAS